MSIFDLAIVTLKPKRKIGPFSVRCSIEESAEDVLEITEYPVQSGAVISDHAFLRPVTLRMVVVYNRWAGNLADLYKRFLDLQSSRELIDVSTGKRSYKNMLIQSIAQTTEAGSEYILELTLNFKQVIVVESQSVRVPPRAKQRSPKVTGEVSEQGKKQGENKSKDQSLLDKLGGIFSAAAGGE